MGDGPFLCLSPPFFIGPCRTVTPIVDRVTGNRLESTLIRTNHARVMYDCPPELIREETKG